MEALAKQVLKISGCHLNLPLPFADLLVVSLLWQFSCLLRRGRGLLVFNPMENRKTGVGELTAGTDPMRESTAGRGSTGKGDAVAAQPAGENAPAQRAS